MTITRIHQVESGLDKLLEQFKGKYNIESVLTAYLQQNQDTQQAYEEMLDERSLTTAVGVQLDNLGVLVGEDRNLRDDDEYRLAITIKILINTSKGTLPNLKSIIKILTGATSVKIVEHYPASIYIYIRGEEPDKSLIDIVSKVLPVGVSLGYIGYGENDLLFIPYDREYIIDDLITNNSENIVDNTGDNIVVATSSPSSLIENAYLAESPDTLMLYGKLTETI